MNKRLKFIYLICILISLSSCGTLIKKDHLIDESANDNEKLNPKKERIEIRFSCGEDNIANFTDDGWTIVEQYTEEKICTWKSSPATKDCDMERDKGCKITKPDKIGEERIYLLER